MKISVTISFLLLLFNGMSQVNFTWKELWTVTTSPNSVATIDAYNNLYYIHQETLYKVDSVGKRRFNQSDKSWSRIAAIDTRNPMKLMLFSESQQVIEYLDNTLTKQQDFIDLNEEGFSFVTKMTSSSQPDKVWLFDSDNSRLVLFSKNIVQRQQIDNIYGLLNVGDVTQIVEFNNQLFVVDDTKGIFVLDRYGTLMNFIEIKGIQQIQLEGDILYYLQKGELYFYNLQNKDTSVITVPIADVKHFFKNGIRFYLQTDNQINAYQIN